jgi:hypothetical protein
MAIRVLNAIVATVPVRLMKRDLLFIAALLQNDGPTEVISGEQTSPTKHLVPTPLSATVLLPGSRDPLALLC